MGSWTFDELRALTRRHRGTLHLFLYAPLGGAVLVGNLWNRMPTTQQLPRCRESLDRFARRR